MNFDNVIETFMTEMKIEDVNEALMVYKSLLIPREGIENMLNECINECILNSGYDGTLEEAMKDYDLFIQHFKEDKSYDVLDEEFNLESKVYIKRFVDLFHSICKQYIFTEKYQQIKNIIKYKTPLRYVLDDKLKSKAQPIKEISDTDAAMYILYENPDFKLSETEIGKLFHVSQSYISAKIKRMNMLRKYENIRANLINGWKLINSMITEGKIKKPKYATPAKKIFGVKL